MEPSTAPDKGQSSASSSTATGKGHSSASPYPHAMNLSTHVLHHAENMDVQFILEEMALLCGARFGVLNLYDEDGRTFRSVAVTGLPGVLDRGVRLLGFNPLGRAWKPDEARSRHLAAAAITQFESLSAIASSLLPASIIQLVTDTFRLGSVYLLRIASSERILGDFTMLMTRGEILTHPDLVELCLNQIGGAMLRRISEENLSQSRRLTATIMETSIDAFWILSPVDGGILTVNDAFCHLTGYTRAELLGMRISDLDVVETPQETAAHIQKILTYGSDRFQTRHRCKDGTLLDMDITATWMAGDRPSLICFGRDITDRVKAEERQAEILRQLEESESRFKLLHNASFGGISIHDHGRILEANQGLSDMMGYPMEEMIGMDGLLLVAPHDRDRVMANILAGYEKPYEADGVRKNGDIFPMRLEARNILYHGKKVRVVEFRDLSEQKRIENERRQSEEKFRQLFYHMNSVNSIYDVVTDREGRPVDFRYVSVNQAFERLVGMRSGELEGRTLLEVFPQTEPYWIEQLAEVARTGESVHFEDYSQVLDAYVEMDIYSQQKGQLVMMSHDVSERAKAAQAMQLKTQALEALNVELNTALENLATANEELVAATRRAEDASRAKGQFLANMAHEIRTPMNGFLGMMQLLERTALSGKQLELLRIATSSFHSLMAVLNGILDYTKIEEGMVKMTQAPFALRQSVREVVSLFSPSAVEKHLDMHLSIDPAMPDRWVGDPFRLRQILSNLVGNAVKYTQKGAIHIAVERDATGQTDTGAGKDHAVEIGSSANDGSQTLLFTIRDTGIGIDAQHLDKLFTRFSQVDASMTRNYSGSGLGLAICKGLVENMGGRIWVESEPGVGSTFRFTCVLQAQGSGEDGRLVP